MFFYYDGEHYTVPDKWLEEHDKQIKVDHIREVEKKVRAEVVEELFNIHCKDVSQNECDSYVGCYQCKYERLVQKSLKMQGLKFEEQK